MGYTHYWTQKRNFTVAQWEEVSTDLRAITEYAQHQAGIVLANDMGEGGTSPEFSDDMIMLNGLGEDGHETFVVRRKIRTAPDYPGEQNMAWEFCKTARKPYDAVVTACLCYLSTVTRRDDPNSGEPIIGTEAFTVTSDGKGNDFLVGLDLARKAVPRVANTVDIPMAVMQSDRWCAPWVNDSNNKTYNVNFCVDGRGYILKPRTGQSYCFDTHAELALFLDKTKHASFATGGSTGWGSYGREEPDIWNAYGSFNEARWSRIARAQSRVLAKLFPVPMNNAKQPPAFVRPGEMPEEGGREFCYSVSDLMNLLEGKAA